MPNHVWNQSALATVVVLLGRGLRATSRNPHALHGNARADADVCAEFAAMSRRSAQSGPAATPGLQLFPAPIN